jgi:pimeloyl-ACP methyl ester carboxylesterase
MAADVLAAVRHLRDLGATTIAVIGGSAGGGAAAQASVESPAAIDRLVLLAPMSIDAPEGMHGRTLVVTARDDLGGDDRPRLPGIEAQFARMPDPKRLVVVEGSAHGQRIFGSAAGPELLRLIIEALRSP